MSYPQIYTRLCNFVRDAMGGLTSPAPAKLDAELNNIQLSLAQVANVQRGITTPDGRLRNVARAIAQSLVGTSALTGDGTVTLTTTIPFDSAMSTNSLLVLVNGVLLRPAQLVSALDDGSGFLEITTAVAVTLGANVVVWAFEPGAGLLTRLQSQDTGDGASLIAIEDAGNFYGAEDVEGALAEVAGSLVALQTALGDLADYFKRDGSVVATGDFDLGGFKITNSADGVNPGDLVTVGQMAGYIAAWSDLSRFFIKRDGTTPLAGDFNFGGNKGINLADADLTASLDAVNVRTLLQVLATSGAIPVGTVVDYMGTTTPSADWLFADGQVYPDASYPILSALLGSAFRSGSAQGAIVASFANVIAGGGAGEVTGGALGAGSILGILLTPGTGYVGVPVITVVNPSGVAPTSQPTFSVTLSTAVVDGGSVSGGSITAISVLTGGTGIEVGASLMVVNDQVAAPGTPALAPLPTGYFRTADYRGRVSIGAGTESKSPGITDPPDVTKGDDYNATTYAVGAYGGEQAHSLVEDENARHQHQVLCNAVGGGGGTALSGNSNGFPGGPLTSYSGLGAAHENRQPYLAMQRIVKAK